MPTLKVWNGTDWEYLTGGAAILQQDAEPGTPVEGDLWIDTDESAQSGSSAFLKDYAITRRTAGDLLANTTTWVDVDTGMDLVLTAAVGDVVEVGISLIWNNDVPHGLVDVCSVVGGSPVNYWGNNGAESATSNGVVAWWGEAGRFVGAGGGVQRTMVSGDISSGTVTLRLRRRALTTGNKYMLADASNQFVFWAKNYGPVT